MLMIHLTSYCHFNKFMGPRNACLRPKLPSTIHSAVRITHQAW